MATLDLNLLCRGYLPSVNLVIRNEQVVGSILTTGSLSKVQVYSCLRILFEGALRDCEGFWIHRYLLGIL